MRNNYAQIVMVGISGTIAVTAEFGWKKHPTTKIAISRERLNILLHIF